MNADDINQIDQMLGRHIKPVEDRLVRVESKMDGATERIVRLETRQEVDVQTSTKSYQTFWNVVRLLFGGGVLVAAGAAVASMI